jgi:competence protein ComFC
MKTWGLQFRNYMRHMLLPSFCSHCNVLLEEPEIFCLQCYSKIVPVVSKQIPVTPMVDISVFAATAYVYPVRSLVVGKRFSNRIASWHLGRIMCEMIPLNSLPCDYVVPVPLHWSRYAFRGYNQTQILAECVAQYKKKSVVSVLRRVKRTKYQSDLNVEDRIKNVQHGFALGGIKDPLLFTGKHILLVDDLMTTGATLRSAARELIKLEPAQITAVVGCRVT